jgi:hypothetical protein
MLYFKYVRYLIDKDYTANDFDVVMDPEAENLAVQSSSTS